MYEIVARINGKVILVDTADNIVSASNITSYHRMNGLAAWYRPILTKVA